MGVMLLRDFVGYWVIYFLGGSYWVCFWFASPSAYPFDVSSLAVPPISLGAPWKVHPRTHHHELVMAR